MLESLPEEIILPSVVEQIIHPLFIERNIKVSIKRDDRIHQLISGNKWRKLSLNCEKCNKEHYDGMLTFGGAFSNHIRATAAAGKLLGIKTIGIIRGNELNPASRDGMKLVFTSREEYDLRNEKYYQEELRRRYGNYLVVPEGGANYYGVLGCVDIVAELSEHYDHIILPCGTGTTAAGILLGSADTRVIGIPVLKNGRFLMVEIERLLFECGLTPSDIRELLHELVLETDYHFGGYAKYNDDLIDFINRTYEETGIPLDQVYTGKMFYALMDMVRQGKFEEGATILVLHTGGLQGSDPVKERLSWWNDVMLNS